MQVQPHRPTRPGWICDRDGLAWPCPDARRALRMAFGEDHTGLQHCLAALLLRGECELASVPRVELYRRFVGWALAPGEKCRVCDSPKHAVLPGVPPRIVPCGKLRAAMRQGRPT